MWTWLYSSSSLSFQVAVYINVLSVDWLRRRVQHAWLSCEWPASGATSSRCALSSLSCFYTPFATGAWLWHRSSRRSSSSPAAAASSWRCRRPEIFRLSTSICRTTGSSSYPTWLHTALRYLASISASLRRTATSSSHRYDRWLHVSWQLLMMMIIIITHIITGQGILQHKPTSCLHKNIKR